MAVVVEWMEGRRVEEEGLAGAGAGVGTRYGFRLAVSLSTAILRIEAPDDDGVTVSADAETIALWC